MHVTKLAEIAKQRAAASDQLNALAMKSTLNADEVKEFDVLSKSIDDLTNQESRIKTAQAQAVKSAQPVAGQIAVQLPAQAKTFDAYEKKDGLVLGGIVRMLGAARGPDNAGAFAEKTYGGSHPVTKAFAEGTGAGGGFLVPPDYMTEVIELLRARAVIRAAGPRVIPMPRGTMTLPDQNSAASASYGAEGVVISTSAPGVGQIQATAKKLTALVPISNELLRDTGSEIGSTAADALVRDDLVQVTALREDLAFLMGDGTAGTPRGYLSFATAFGNNLLPSIYAYSLTTVSGELGSLVNALDTANVPDFKRVWFMNPRTKNYLYNLLNSLGVYVYRDEMNKGMLLGYPFKTTTQIPTNVTYASNPGCSYIFLAEMTETMLLDTMQLELMVSQEGTYTNSVGATVSAVASDQTLIRAISRHDFQMRHDASVAVLQGVAYAPVG